MSTSNPLMFMDVESSEMVKYASNAMLACKISFINEIARITEHYGADIARVREGMCADKRIGDQFLFPGLGPGRGTGTGRRCVCRRTCLRARGRCRRRSAP